MENTTPQRFLTRLESIDSEYPTDVILVVGKGPSLDDIDLDVSSRYLTIGLNDAHRMVDADVSIFREEWVEPNPREGSLNVVPVGLHSGPSFVEVVQHPPGVEGSDSMMRRLQDPTSLEIEQVLLVTALKVARLIARARGEDQKVYLLGLDFSGERYATALTVDANPADGHERQVAIEQQEFFLMNALYVLEGSELLVQHVGDRPFSSLSTHRFSRTFARASSSSPAQGIAPRSSSLDEGLLITAEITTNHFGSRQRLERLIRAAKAAGADLVKLQKRDVETFYDAEVLAAPFASPFGTTFGDYRRALELSRDDFAFVDELCKELGIHWFASALDYASFEFLMDFETPIIKIPSTISSHVDYLQRLADTYSGRLVVSTGMTDARYESWILDTFSHVERLYLLHCNSAYPTPDRDCNVAVVRHYLELSEAHPNLVPGYSSHDAGWFGSALAVAAGARMVEKHIKAGNTAWAHFDAVALDIERGELDAFVENLRRAEILTGSPRKRITASEHHKYSGPARPNPSA